MNRSTLLASALLAAGMAVGGWFLFANTSDQPTDEPKRDPFGGSRIPGSGEPPLPKRDKFGEDRAPLNANAKMFPLDEKRFLSYLKQLCDIGPRVSNTPGMTKQQELITKHFEGLGAKVTRQEFKGKQRSVKQEIPMVNLIISYFPERKRRVIFCSHYDTRPAAHQEPNRLSWAKPFVSANDGTSGVALFMELAHHLKDFPTDVGLDIVLFDGEEYIFEMGIPGYAEGDVYFLGSEYFAADYQKNKGKLPYTYSAGILLDLFGHDKARLALEGYSMRFAPALLDEVWKVAKSQGAKSFVTERGFNRANEVLDDHLALNAVGIPTIDIIDFDYAHWHLLSDTPDKVSAKQSLEVGQVLLGWLQNQKTGKP
jgi:glutaminyl-peptide cyclotransferase